MFMSIGVLRDIEGAEERPDAVRARRAIGGLEEIRHLRLASRFKAQMQPRRA